MQAPLEGIAVLGRDLAALRMVRAIRAHNLEHGTGFSSLAVEPPVLDHRESNLDSASDNSVRSSEWVREADAQLFEAPLAIADTEASGAILQAWKQALAQRLSEGDIRAIWLDANLPKPISEAVVEMCGPAGIGCIGAAELLPEGLVITADHLESEKNRACNLTLVVITDKKGALCVLPPIDRGALFDGVPVLCECPPSDLSLAVAEQLSVCAADHIRTSNTSGVFPLRFRLDQTGALMSICGAAPEMSAVEALTGLDMYTVQLGLALGITLDDLIPGHREGERYNAPNSTAMSIDLRARDPERGFAPAAGLLDRFVPVSLPGVAAETAYATGDRLPDENEAPLLAVFRARAIRRNRVLALLRSALAESEVTPSGGATDKAFLLECLDRALAGIADYFEWMEGLNRGTTRLEAEHADAALLIAAVEAYLADVKVDRSLFFQTARRGRPKVNTQEGRSLSLAFRGHEHQFRVMRLDINRYTVTTAGQTLKILDETSISASGRTGRGIESQGRRMRIGNSAYRVRARAQSDEYLIDIDGYPYRIIRAEGSVVRAPAPSVISAINVAPGQHVEAGDTLLMVEAMKMEMAVLADRSGTVKAVPVRNHMQVDAGTPLVRMQFDEDVPIEGEAPDFGRFHNEQTDQDTLPRSACEKNLRELTGIMLGFDADPEHIKTVIATHRGLCAELPDGDKSLWEAENRLLDLFSAILALFRREPIHDAMTDSGRLSSEGYLFTYLQDLRAGADSMPERFMVKLRRALGFYGIQQPEPGPELETSLYRMFRSFKRMNSHLDCISDLLARRLELASSLANNADTNFRELIDRVVQQTRTIYPQAHDLAREVRFSYFEAPLIERARRAEFQRVEAVMDLLRASSPGGERSPDHDALIHELVTSTQAMKGVLADHMGLASIPAKRNLLEVITRRYYRLRELEALHFEQYDRLDVLRTHYRFDDRKTHVVALQVEESMLASSLTMLAEHLQEIPDSEELVVDAYVKLRGDAPTAGDETGNPFDRLSDRFLGWVQASGLPTSTKLVTISAALPDKGAEADGVHIYTFKAGPEGFVEQRVYRNIHPMMVKRLEIWRLDNFDIRRLPSSEDLYMFLGQSKEDPGDRRLFTFGEVRETEMLGNGDDVRLPFLEMMLSEALSSMRRYLAAQPRRKRPFWNRILLYVWPMWEVDPDRLQSLLDRLAPATKGLGLEKIVLQARIADASGEDYKETVIELARHGDTGMNAVFRAYGDQPIRTMSTYARKASKLRSRGLIYPYELIRMITPEGDSGQSEFPPGMFEEYDLDAEGELVPAERTYGRNTTNIVTGLIRNYTTKYPEGITRVVIAGDPSRGMGNLAEAECRRIMAALDLAQEMNIPAEWYAVSAGARIAMDSGTENMDWIALVLRRIIDFTQAGGELNIIVTGVNVGAQPYWNAEATMLMHTKGILIMSPDVAMVLTGKQALDYSGGVSADDNEHIGGYERIMGPNGQAQYFANTTREACSILLHHYEHTYVMPGERFPRPIRTGDPIERDVCDAPHDERPGSDLPTVGHIFSDQHNPGRKKRFDIRRIMRACIDTDSNPLERWHGMEDAEIAVVWDAHLGGYPVCMIGIESQPVPRLGFLPADGPETWTGGTLFPMGSKKIARAINAASGNRPVVVLANLSGFDGSPESLRRCQLEFGAEIGRAVVNFKGPISMCVVSRYHGGAFVVFSNKLNDNMEVAALEGTYASVIGGAPAAAVVFARDVKNRTGEDPRVVSLDKRITEAQTSEKGRLHAEMNALFAQVYSEKLGVVAEEFDGIHNIERAQRVGSVDRIIPPEQLRPFLVQSVERGMEREMERLAQTMA